MKLLELFRNLHFLYYLVAAEVCTDLALKVTENNGIFTYTDYLGDGTTNGQTFKVSQYFMLEYHKVLCIILLDLIILYSKFFWLLDIFQIFSFVECYSEVKLLCHKN